MSPSTNTSVRFVNFRYLLIPLLVTLLACGGSDSSETSIVVATSNTAPVANAGLDQNVSVGVTVTLDASASTDADGDTLAYNWVLSESPANSTASLQNQTDVSPTFNVDIAGNYTLSLTVNDGSVTSTEDSVVIIASNNNVDITNVNFSNRQGSCMEYVGSYSSNVTDIQRNINFVGDIDISDEGKTCVIASNEIPNHDFNDLSASFASDVSEQNSVLSIVDSPQFAEAVTPLELGFTNVIFLNGTTADILSAACYGVGDQTLGTEKVGCTQAYIDHPWRYDPMSPLNTFGTDSHNAHVQPNGKYHYHGNPVAMFEQDCDIQGTPSPVIGFAADGFPVYGSCFTDPVSNSVKKAQSSFGLKNNGGERAEVSGYATPEAGQGVVTSNNYDGLFTSDYEYIEGSGDLDECNGMTIDGQYGYYVTDSYPWILACYKGEINDSFIKTGAALQNRLHGHADNVHSH
jgi:hypothetical protein